MTHPKASRRDFLGGVGSLALGSMAAAATPATPPRAEPVEEVEVLVIGAGLAGLTAARDLLRAGQTSVVVLEARDRVGGRTLNHRLRNGQVCDAGAEWIGPGHTAIEELARDLGIATFPSEYAGKTVFRSGRGRFLTDTGGTFSLDDPRIVAELEAMARRVDPARPWAAPNAAALDRLSFGAWLQSKRPSDADFISYWAACLLTTGGGLFDYSLLHYLTLIASAGTVQGVEAMKDGAQERRFHGGSQLLSLRMAEQLGNRVRLRHPVTTIEGWNGPRVRVTAGGRVFSAGQVIVAVSPVLCNRIAWTPALPQARAELQRRWPAHGSMMKSATVYATPFWLKAGFSGQVLKLGGPVILTYDDSAADKSFGVIGAFHRIGDTPSDPARAKAAVASILADAMDDKRFLEPLEFHIHDWGQEAYSITCTPPMPPGLLTSGLMPSLVEPMGKVIWAGTEAAERFALFMDGAVRSGHRAAFIALQRHGAAAGGRA